MNVFALMKAVSQLSSYVENSTAGSSHFILYIVHCTLQKDNDGIVMTTFVPAFINCTDPDGATLKDVAGKKNVIVNVHNTKLCLATPLYWEAQPIFQ